MKPFQISLYQENSLPQDICWKCVGQLKNSYKFIHQACKVSQQYLENSQEDVKNIEQLQESLIEISEAPIVDQAQEELKVEPFDIECNLEIKEENLENEVFMPTIIVNNDESQEEM